jgi:ketosteroid isomerase-like protein
MSVRDEIEKLNGEFTKAVANQDAKALAAFYTDDTRLLPPGAPMVEGRNATRDWFQTMIDAGVKALDLNSIAVESGGEMVVDVGTYRLTVQPPGAEAAVDEGKYIVVFKRQGGGDLKIAYDTFNSDFAPPS